MYLDMTAQHSAMRDLAFISHAIQYKADVMMATSSRQIIRKSRPLYDRFIAASSLDV